MPTPTAVVIELSEDEARVWRRGRVDWSTALTLRSRIVLAAADGLSNSHAALGYGAALATEELLPLPDEG